MFKHDNSTLELKVQTDDQASQIGDKEKDPRSLSGGEKSFSTICLLLALWESIGCPIRCLGMFQRQHFFQKNNSDADFSRRV